MKKKEFKEKFKKNKKKIIIGGTILAAVGIGGYFGISRYASKCYQQGADDMHTMLAKFNYQNIKRDAVYAQFDDIFKSAYEKNLAYVITNKKGKNIYCIGDHQKLKFIEEACRADPKLREAALKLLK